MPRYLPFRQEQVALLFREGLSDAAIHQRVGVPERTLRFWRKNWKRDGTFQAPPKGTIGPPKKLSDSYMQALLEWLEVMPHAYLDEMVYFLWDNFSIRVTDSCVSKRLDKAGWKRHVAQRVAAQRNEDTRNLWRLTIGGYKASQCVFIDESAACERNLDRKYGWSPANTTVRTSQLLLERKDRFSVLPAYTVNGYLRCTKIHQGYITIELFLEWIQKEVLPRCVPYPGPRSVLIMDNCAIHHSPELQTMCCEAGVVLQYLPPYSPDFNPIEEAFHDLKQWLKRHGNLMTNPEDFAGFLEHAILAQDGSKAKAHFRNSLVPMD